MSKNKGYSVILTTENQRKFTHKSRVFKKTWGSTVEILQKPSLCTNSNFSFQKVNRKKERLSGKCIKAAEYGINTSFYLSLLPSFSIRS